MIRELVIAAAGAGKSTRIANEAIDRAKNGEKVLILTYTEANQMEIRKKITNSERIDSESISLGNIVVKGWFSFLIDDFVRPYQRCMFQERIEGLFFNESGNPHIKIGSNGKPFITQNKSSPNYYVLEKSKRAHSMFLGDFAASICKNEYVTQTNIATKQKVSRAALRLSEIYSAVFIDEVQDLVGYDYEIISELSKPEALDIICVGDFRQTIYRTSNARKKPETTFEKLKYFDDLGYKRTDMAISHRCSQAICDLADSIFEGEEYEKTESRLPIPKGMEHLGVFFVYPNHVADYFSQYKPTILRDKKSIEKKLCEDNEVFNFGKSKGLGFRRTLIIPTNRQLKFLLGETNVFDNSKTNQEQNKFYVAVTRAQYSVAFLWGGEKPPPNDFKVWTPLGL